MATPRVIPETELLTPTGQPFLATLQSTPDAHLLGVGNTGTVRAAQWRPAEAPGRSVPVAVKTALLGAAGGAGAAAEASYRREAAVQADLSHPHIAALHGLGEFSVGGARALHCVMELGSGGGLDALVQSGGELHSGSTTFPLGSLARLARVAHLGAQAALGLLQAHARGYAHCDVKLANLILSPAGRVLVTDFGIAFRVRQGGRPLAPAGTLPGQRENLGSFGYMPPENFGPPESFSGPCLFTGQPACDVYALAFVLLELAQGALVTFKLAEFAAVLPEQGSALAELGITCAGRNLRPRMPEAVDPRLAALIQACWVADPRARPPMAEVARQLLDVHSQASAALLAEVDAARIAAALAEQAAQQALLAAQERAALAEEAAASARAACEASAARLQQTEAAMTQLRAEHEQCSALQDAAVRQHAKEADRHAEAAEIASLREQLAEAQAARESMTSSLAQLQPVEQGHHSGNKAPAQNGGASLPSVALTGGGSSSSATPPGGTRSNLNSVGDDGEEPLRAAAKLPANAGLFTAGELPAGVDSWSEQLPKDAAVMYDCQSKLAKVSSMKAEITAALNFQRRFGGTMEDWERELPRVTEKEKSLQARLKDATANYHESQRFADDEW